MSYALRLPKAWIVELNAQSVATQINLYQLAGQVMQESSWNEKALGDYVGGVATSFGLGQLQVAAAKDAGWQGIHTEDLLVAALNLQLMGSYLKLCQGWARTYDNQGDIVKYGLTACAQSVYNQGPGGFQKRGIAGNLDSYVRPVQRWADEIQAGGISVDTSGDPYVPPPVNPGDPPPPPDQTPPSLEELMSKYADSVRKAIAAERMARPWPPADDYQTDVGKVLYFLATTLRDVANMLQEWVGRI